MAEISDTFDAQFSKYKLHAEESKWEKNNFLGWGGSGTVWLEEGKGGRLMAVKQITKDTKFRNGNPYNFQDTYSQRELLAMTQLNKYPQHFVRFLGWSEDKNNIYFAMDYIKDGDLYAHSERANITEREVKIITAQLLEGLEILHKNNFCHRDLKLQNILITSPSPIKVIITDFGLSKNLVGTELRTTDAGTEGYMAPEIIFKPNPVYSIAVDMWSLGCIIYRLLTKKEPFTTNQLVKLYYENGVFPAAEQANDRISQAAIEFIAKLLRVEPEERLTAGLAFKEPWLYF